MGVPQPSVAHAHALPFPLISDAGDGTPPPAPAAQAELDENEFRELFDHAGGLLAILDVEGHFIAANAACRQILGYGPEALIGRTLFDFVQSADGTRIGGGDRIGRRHGDCAAVDSFFELLARHPHADGTWRWLRWSGSTHGERWYAAARDVTDWVVLEDRVGRDPLTQLPNREVFTNELTAALARREGTGTRLAVLFVDVDGLKQINDSVGHDAGDRLLAQVGERLRAAVRTEDIVGRLGGDEFGVLVESLSDEREAAGVARRVLSALEAPLELGTGPITTSASIGIALDDGCATSASGLIRDADVAMYRAKTEGRNRFVMFDEEMRVEMQARLDMERDLHQALARNELILHYQPTVSLENEKIVGAEALLRWSHPSRGLLMPADFLPLAEQNGLILPLGRWVLQTAAKQAASWALLDSPDIVVSVNIAARELIDDELIGSVRAALETSGLTPGRFCLEFSEDGVLADLGRVATRLRGLRELGVRIAFDGFGFGYSSLRALLSLPIDTIKLDRAFVAEFVAGAVPETRALLIATVVAGHELGIRVVACGVDDQPTLQAVRAAGCDCVQGDAAPRPAVQPSGAASPHWAGLLP